MPVSMSITTYRYRNYLCPFCQSRCGNLRLGPGYQPECKKIKMPLISPIAAIITTSLWDSLPLPSLPLTILYLTLPLPYLCDLPSS